MVMCIDRSDTSCAGFLLNLIKSIEEVEEEGAKALPRSVWQLAVERGPVPSRQLPLTIVLGCRHRSGEAVEACARGSAGQVKMLRSPAEEAIGSLHLLVWQGV